jgi:hypothetical protein
MLRNTSENGVVRQFDPFENQKSNPENNLLHT